VDEGDCDVEEWGTLERLGTGGGGATDNNTIT